MSYLLSDVDAAERRIRDACPGVRLHRSDYGFGLTAIRYGKVGPIKAVIVYRPAMLSGETELTSDIDVVIEELNRG